MYNLHVQLPSEIRVASQDHNTITDEQYDDSDTTGNKRPSLGKSNNGRHANELLLKMQLLAAKQKELGEIKQANLLTGKISSELKNYSDQQLNYLKQVSTNVTSLAMAIANKIIYNKAETDQSFIAKIVDNTLKTTNNEQYFVIQINPEDKANLDKYWNQILENNNHLSKIAIEENVSVKKGGCIIKTPNGTIDAQIEKQLAIIEEALLQKFSGLVYEQR